MSGKHRWIIVLALHISVIAVTAQPISIDFESLPGMTNIPGTAVPVESQLSDQFRSTLGVSFSSGSPYVAVNYIGAGHAASGVNAIAGTTPGGFMTYESAFPIIARFFNPPVPSTPAVTDYVGLTLDLDGSSGNTVRLDAFDINGFLIGSTTSSDSGGARIEVSAPNIHSVQFFGTRDTDGAGLDDFTFNPVMPIPEPSSFLIWGGSAAVGLMVWARRFRMKRS